MVQKAEEREHSLFNRVRNAEYARQKQEQKVKKIQSKLHEVRVLNDPSICLFVLPPSFPLNSIR